MSRDVLLSIYIATYNRLSIINDKIRNILKLESEDFDIWVLDDCSDDGTYEELKKINDTRLHILRNKSRKGCLKDGAMTNWYRLLEECDGLFMLHLNDRDVLHGDVLFDFIRFLKNHKDYSGGICDSYSGVKIYESPEESLLSIPYRAVHPTGVVFRTDLYRSILRREEYFTKERSYIHPHDLVLGDLSRYGKMFEFYKIYNLADTNSFANNRSFLYKRGSEHTSWFSPEERTKEFELFIIHLSGLDFKEAIKKQKALKIAKSYLYYCTFNYMFYVTDPGQTQHYGIEPQKITGKDLFREMKKYILKSGAILKQNNLIDDVVSYQMKLTSYFWMIYIGKPLWDLYKKGANRKW